MVFQQMMPNLPVDASEIQLSPADMVGFSPIIYECFVHPGWWFARFLTPSTVSPLNERR